MQPVRNADLERRAFAAYFRTAARDGGIVDQPSSPEVWRDDTGRQYVVLPGGRGPGPCADYRVRNDGMLKRLKRWPSNLPVGD
jgi:hypothetical protein